MIITDEKILRKQNDDVLIEEGKEIIILLQNELKNHNGVGLAAPQIGINKNVAIIRYDNKKIDLINPKILELDYGFINKDEGCLSIPNRIFNTFRFKYIYLKDDLHPAGIVATDEEAIVFQHEVDHLNGILLIDREVGKKINRNDPCPCGKVVNGKILKFKKCHGK
jgi:peptide deformylase